MTPLSERERERKRESWIKPRSHLVFDRKKLIIFGIISNFPPFASVDDVTHWENYFLLLSVGWNLRRMKEEKEEEEAKERKRPAIGRRKFAREKEEKENQMLKPWKGRSGKLFSVYCGKMYVKAHGIDFRALPVSLSLTFPLSLSGIQKSSQFVDLRVEKAWEK